MPQEPINISRILALNVRPQRFGFAVFKGPNKLLDWGRSTYATGQCERALQVAKRIDPLLTIYAPSVVVVRKFTKQEAQQHGDLRPILSVIRKETAKHSATVISVGREEVRRAFRSFGKTTKYQIAAQVAIIFSELMWKLPPPRKAWQNEHHNMAIFDAVALGVAYFSRFGEFGLQRRDASESFPQLA